MKQTKENVRVHPETMSLIVDATWDFAHQNLWRRHNFTEAEVEAAKQKIANYYKSIPPEKFTRTAMAHLNMFCERILMARNYVRRYPYRYISHPTVWLDRRNPKGFAGTKKWYEHKMERERKQVKHLLLPPVREARPTPIDTHFHYSESLNTNGYGRD